MFENSGSDFVVFTGLFGADFVHVVGVEVPLHSLFMAFEILENLSDVFLHEFSTVLLRAVDQVAAAVLRTQTHIVLGEWCFHRLGNESLM